MIRRAAIAFAACCMLGFIFGEAAISKHFDFRAFYCAGSAVNAGANPYHTEPLHTCERDRTDRAFAVFARDVALPAPQPGYVIAAMRPFARLPFQLAERLWALVLLAALALAIAASIRLTGLQPAFVLAAFFMALCIPSLGLGELIPVAVAGICTAAYAAQRGRWDVAALGAAVAMAEPHIALPVCIALAVWAPASRLALFAAMAALAALSVATLGFGANVEYVRSVLPLHALSEIGGDAQLSLSVVLHWIGVPDAAALRAGMLSYAVMAALGVWGGRLLWRRSGEPAFVVAVPAAAALLGGSFIHVTDMAAAIPLALLSYARFPRYRTTGFLTLLLLAVPWWALNAPMAFDRFTNIVLGAIVVFALVAMGRRSIVTAAAAALCAAALAVGLTNWYASGTDAARTHPAPVSAAIDPRYPEASWAMENREYMSSGHISAWLLRAPTWIALLLLGWSAFRFALGTDPDGLYVRELVDAERRELAPVSAALHAAER